MRFACEKCKTKYSIDDARVRGKILKIRCKTCSHIITVREDMAPPPTGQLPTVQIPKTELPGAKPVAKPASQALAREADRSLAGQRASGNGSGGGGGLFNDGPERTQISAPSMLPNVLGPLSRDPDWYVSFDGEQEGPYLVEKAAERARLELGRGKEAFCWRENFDDWLPVTDVPELAKLLKPAEKPRAATPPPSAGPPRLPESVRPVATITSARAATGDATMMDMSLASVTAAMQARGVAAPGVASALAVVPEPVNDAKTVPSPAPVPEAKPAALARDKAAAEKAAAEKAAAEKAAAAKAAAEKAAIEKAAAERFAAEKLAAEKAAAEKLAAEKAAVAARAAADKVAAPKPSAILDEAAMHLNITEASVIARLPDAMLQPQAAPVVIVGGGAAPAANPMMKWIVIGLGATTLLLLGTLGWVLFGRKTTGPLPVATAAPITTPAGQKIDDTPVLVADPGSSATKPPAAVAANDPKKPSTAPTTPHAHTPTKGVSGTKPSASMSPDQERLAALYGTPSETPVERALPKVHDTAAQATQVSDTDLRSVVQKNKKSVEQCYDRALKHDNQVRGRLDVQVNVGISGTVTKVTIPDPQFADSEIGGCLKETIKHWHFPSSGAEYATEFPLILQAN